MSSDAKKRYVVRAAEAFDQHDAGGFVAEFTADGTFRDPIQADELTPEELREYFRDVFAALLDVGSDIHRVVVSNDGDFGIDWSMDGTHEIAFEGMPATGNRFEVSGASTGTVSEDGIVCWRDYGDIRDFLDQLGLAFPAVCVQLPKLADRTLRV